MIPSTENRFPWHNVRAIHAVLILLLAILPDGTYSASSSSKSDSKKGEDAFKPMRLAFCVTGQLARLELLSKIANVFIPNAQLGHTVHLFMLLDNEDEVKQTFWRYDYSGTPYVNYNNKKMETFIEKKVENAKLGDKFKARIRLEPRSQNMYEVVEDFVPVDPKEINCKKTVCGKGENPTGKEEASARFQNNLSWMGGLRDCVKWMQIAERAHGIFYDLVIRLRDDTLVFDKWLFDKDKMKGALTSMDLGSYNGINDHNMIIDRRWADTMFRGMIEDYYFNKTSKHKLWNNTEHHIYEMTQYYDIPIRTSTMCDMPLIPLRNNENATHWLTHLTYASKMLEACTMGKEKDRDCDCSSKTEWLNLFSSGYSPINWPKIP